MTTAPSNRLSTPVTGGQPGAGLIEPPVLPRRKSALSSLVRRPTSLLGLAWLVALIVLVLGAPVLGLANPTIQHLGDASSGPSGTHLLGTDQLGRDILARLAFGGRVALLGVLIATVVAVVLGGIAGLVAGYFRGRLDIVLSGVADVLMSIPMIVVVLSVVAVVSRNLPVVMIVVGVLMSAAVFRVVRGAALDVRQALFVTAARTSGLGNGRIIARHLLPRLAAVTVVQATIVASLSLVTQVSLGFLNIDVAPPAPSWGNLIKDASTNLYTSMWPIVPPTLFVGFTVLALSAVGDALQQSLTGRGRSSGLGRGAQRVRELQAVSAAPSQPDGVARPPVEGSLLSIRDFSLAVPSGKGFTTLVDRVSLDIRPGEVVGLVGESGAGKSVTARSILGLYPTGATVSGSLRYRGEETIGAPEAEMARLRGTEIAFISQEPMASLNPVFRIGHQLEEIVRTHRRVGRREAARIARELLETVRIADPDEVARKYPHEVSGGMAQRIVIAIALAGEPRLIIADEPTTALDVSVQMQVLDLLRSLQQERSMGVLLVTHDWGVVADLCDRALAMYAGQVVEEADVEDIFRRPRHPYSAALRAADPHSQAPGSRLLTIPGQVPAPGSWPPGCRFADRCAFARDECRAAPVVLRVVDGGHPVRCVRAEEIGELTHG